MAEAAKSSVSDIDNAIPESDLAKLKDSMQITTREFERRGKQYKKILINRKSTDISYCTSYINNFYLLDGDMIITMKKDKNSPIYYSAKLNLKASEVIVSHMFSGNSDYAQPHPYSLSQEIVSSTK